MTLPRLADWAEWARPIAEATGVGSDIFMAALNDNIGRQHSEINQTDPLAIALFIFLADKPLWTGTASALFAELVKIASEEKLDREPTWPKAPNALSRRLRALSHNLEAGGISVQDSRSGAKGMRTWTITKAEGSPEKPSISSNRQMSNEFSQKMPADSSDDIAGGSKIVSKTESPHGARAPGSDGASDFDDISGLPDGLRDRLAALGCATCPDLHNSDKRPFCIYGDGVVDLGKPAAKCPKQAASKSD